MCLSVCFTAFSVALICILEITGVCVIYSMACVVGINPSDIRDVLIALNSVEQEKTYETYPKFSEHGEKRQIAA